MNEFLFINFNQFRWDLSIFTGKDEKLTRYLEDFRFVVFDRPRSFLGIGALQYADECNAAWEHAFNESQEALP